MVELNKKRVGSFKELKKMKTDNKFKSWNIKTHDKEYYYDEASNYSNAESRQIQIASIRKKAKKNGFIEIKDVEVIEKLFPFNSLDNFYQDSGAFFIWEYSGATLLLDDKEERIELFEKMSQAEANAIVLHLHSAGLTQSNIFINDNDDIEISRKKELNILDKNGNPIMVKIDGRKGNPHPKRRPMQIDDFSLSQIKKAMKELKIKITK